MAQPQELVNSPSPNIIVVGIGTTGSQLVDYIVSTLKLYSRSNLPPNQEGNLPTNQEGTLPTNQAFIAMDSFEQELANLKRIPPEDRINILKPPVNLLQQNDPDLPNDYNIIADGGAGLVRRVGLAFYRYNRASIRDRIQQIAARFMRIGQNNNFQIILAASLFGGTGSSFLVEMGLDLKEWLSGTHIPGIGQVTIMAVAILPRMGSESTKKANALATLKEVSYIRSITNPIVVGNRQYVNPFEFFFIVGTEEDRAQIELTEVGKAVTKLLIDLGVIPFNVNQQQRTTALDWSNLRTYAHENMTEFSSFGLYSVGLPVVEIKWLIKAARAIEADKGTLSKTKDSVTMLGADLQKVKENLKGYSQTASKRTQNVSTLIQKLSNGYPKLLRELEDNQTVVDDCNDMPSSFE